MALSEAIFRIYDYLGKGRGQAVERLCLTGSVALQKCMKCNGIQFSRPDPFSPKGITFLRLDPDGRPYNIPLQTHLTKRHSSQAGF